MRRGQADAILARELTLRECRNCLGVSQRQMAVRLGIDLETCRVLDSARRPVPAAILARARLLVSRLSVAINHRGPDLEAESPPAREPLFSLPTLAQMIGVHVRTLWNAARRGQLAVAYDTRTTFRQLRSRSTLAEASRYREQDYGRRHLARSLVSVPTWAAIPRDYDARVRRLRRRMHLTRSAFAQRVGAANKAVIYQWESRKRCPTPVFWQRIAALAESKS